MHKLVLVIVLVTCAAPARATVITTGDVDPGGAGSQPDPWNAGNVLRVGHHADGTLDITAGGAVSNVNGYLGVDPGTTGVATVAGSGSQWNNHALYVGYQGNGTLNIETAGVVSNTVSWIGWSFGLTGQATVTGSGSKWTNSSALWVGYSGPATLNVIDGGVVTSEYSYLSYYTGSTSEVTVTGSGSKWTNSDFLQVGHFDSGTLNVTDGGVVSNTYAIIGRNNVSTSGVAVTGMGSQWNNSGYLRVGDVGSATLNIEAGGEVSNTYGTLGVGPASTGEATVTGSGSQWTNSDKLVVGSSGTGALNVADGGVVSNTNGSIGLQSGSTGEALVSGTGSQWNNSGWLAVGDEGGDGTLHVEAGGVVTSTNGFMGYDSGSTGLATVTGMGSQWTNSSGLYVGYQGNGTLNVEAGGQVSNVVGYLGRYLGSTGVATVTGSGSQWTNSSDLYVGYQGNGTLAITGGGTVSNVNGYLGYSSGSTGEVTVTDTGSQWNNSDNLYVGYEGNGTLNIETSGLVTVGGTTSIGATGTVNLTGGRFEFGQTTLAEFSSINAASGSLAGNLNHAGYTDVATLTALQNPAVGLSDVTLTNSGVLYGEASLGNALINTADGEVETMAGERMRFGGAGNTNAGEINNFAGQIRFDQDMTNESGGFVGGRGQFVADGGWTNQGVMAFSGTTDILGNINIDAGGQIVTLGGATTTIFDDLLHNGLQIRTGTGSRTVIFGQASGAGVYTDVGIVEFADGFSPGNSPAAVSFGGDVVLGISSTTQVELGGLTAGSQYDQLEIAGTVDLDGTLDLVPLAPYTDPGARGTADDFVIITAGARSGNFSTVHYDGSPLTADAATDGSGSFRVHTAGGLFRGVTYTATTVQLQNLLALAGDTDGDRDIDLTDYNRLATNFAPGGNNLAWTDGDFDSDGDVDLSDYNSLASNFKPLGYGTAAVPEPSTALLALLGMLLFRAPGRFSLFA